MKMPIERDGVGVVGWEDGVDHATALSSASPPDCWAMASAMPVQKRLRSANDGPGRHVVDRG
jgi:hypothetical protein